MRRIISVIVVALVIAAMMVAIAMPAFADRKISNFGHCHKIFNQGILVGDSNRELNETFNPPESQGNQEGATIGCPVKTP
jgi:hypothetical protein